jgi:hypothetical protein
MKLKNVFIQFIMKFKNIFIGFKSLTLSMPSISPVTLRKCSCKPSWFMVGGKKGLSAVKKFTVALHLCTAACPVMTCYGEKRGD